jgi:hypothetical protein
VVDGCAGVVEPKFIEFEGAGVDPNPGVGPGAGVEPKVIAPSSAGAVEPNWGAAGAGAGVVPNEKGATGAGAGVDPKRGGATGAGVEPKLGPELGAVAPDVARELFEAFPNEEDPRPEAGVDELFSFEGFPNTKGAGAPACVDAVAGVPPENKGAAGALLEGFDPNCMLGLLEKAVLDSSSFLRLLFLFRSSSPSVATLPNGGIVALLDPIDDVPNENLGAVAVSVGAAEGLPDLPPNENPGVVASAVVEEVEELPPNGRDGAPGVLPLSFAVEVPKLKPL